VNILRIARKLPPCPGGQEHHVVDLSLYQVTTGDSVEVSFGLGDYLKSDSRVKCRRVVSTRVLQFFKRDVLQAFVFGFFVLLKHYNKPADKIDIVHVHGDVIEILFSAAISWKHKVPLVATFHAGVSSRLWYKIVASKVLRLPDAIICVSDDIKNQLKIISPSAVNAAVIHSGIYYSRFSCREDFSCSGSMDIVSVGRLHPMKGFEYLVQAVADESIKDSVKLTIVGDGPERLKLEKLAIKNNVDINFAGYCTKEKIAKILCESQLFVSSSVQLKEQTEGTPTVVMEAMAAGLPVIVTDVGGAKALVRDGENGFVIPQADMGMIVECIKKLLDKSELLDEFSKRNASVADRFDWVVIGGRVNEVYRSLR